MHTPFTLYNGDAISIRTEHLTVLQDCLQRFAKQVHAINVPQSEIGISRSGYQIGYLAGETVLEMNKAHFLDTVDELVSLDGTMQLARSLAYYAGGLVYEKLPFADAEQKQVFRETSEYFRSAFVLQCALIMEEASGQLDAVYVPSLREAVEKLRKTYQHEFSRQTTTLEEMIPSRVKPELN